MTGFDVRGLLGYRVVPYHGAFHLYVTGVVSFGFNETTGEHDLPEHREDWDLLSRSTAKGAVAAAHHHATWVRGKLSRPLRQEDDK